MSKTGMQNKEKANELMRKNGLSCEIHAVFRGMLVHGD